MLRPLFKKIEYIRFEKKKKKFRRLTNVYFGHIEHCALGSNLFSYTYTAFWNETPFWQPEILASPGSLSVAMQLFIVCFFYFENQQSKNSCFTYTKYYNLTRVLFFSVFSIILLRSNYVCSYQSFEMEQKAWMLGVITDSFGR